MAALYVYIFLIEKYREGNRGAKAVSIPVLIPLCLIQSLPDYCIIISIKLTKMTLATEKPYSKKLI